MKNNKKEQTVQDNHEKQVDVSLGKTAEELEEILETLKIQFQQAQTHAVKLQGAIEAVTLMLNGEERIE